MKLAFFRADITPPVGHPLCAGWYPVCTGVADPLSALGVILLPEDDLPVILCALDWAELSNDDYLRWQAALAGAVGTTPDRVSVHCIHAHDAPWPDAEAQAILIEQGRERIIMWEEWCSAARQRVANAALEALPTARTVSSIEAGRAKVDRVASNRRILGPDGKSRGVRWTQCRDASLRDEPEGLIDPWLKSITFRGEDGEKLAVLHYYAVHPTSYDRTGLATPDFVGLARDRRAREEGVPHLYFTECAGNITPGKYNDGESDNRELFTQRLYDAMVAATSGEQRPIAPDTVIWRAVPVILPPRADQEREALLALVREGRPSIASRAALLLAYQQRIERPILISALHLGSELISLHLPGESFIEYQLHAQALRPDAFVVVPSYADCGPGYITLARSFEEGGYEPTDSFCSPESEAILRGAIAAAIASE